MKVYYASMTGNVRRFLGKCGIDAIPISDAPLTQEPFVLVTYTFGFGAVPKEVVAWLNANNRNLRGVAASGNRNWGDYFGMAGDTIAKTYNVPLLHTFELAGTSEDIRIFKERLASLCDITN